MDGIKKALSKYLAVVNQTERARYLKCLNLGEKVEQADKIVESCYLCERRCGANRKAGEKGFCGVGYESRVSNAFAHVGEEKYFVPSGTIFFTGCNSRCVYCQNYDISQFSERGNVWQPIDIAKWIENCDCINVNFVGGEPTPNLHNILKALSLSQRNIPTIWNSNFYMSVESMQLLSDVIDVYLSDFKYGDNECAMKYSSLPKYFETVARNHLLASKNSEMIVRHLILPGHVECCSKKIIDWIADNLGDKVRVNLMRQYQPCYKAHEFSEINRRITSEEYKEVVKHAKKRKLNFEIQMF